MPSKDQRKLLPITSLMERTFCLGSCHRTLRPLPHSLYRIRLLCCHNINDPQTDFLLFLRSSAQSERERKDSGKCGCSGALKREWKKGMRWVCTTLSDLRPRERARGKRGERWNQFARQVSNAAGRCVPLPPFPSHFWQKCPLVNSVIWRRRS